MKTAVIMQARSGSSRLPGKVLKNLCGKTVLEHDIERIRQSKLIDGIIIATTGRDTDDEIVKLAQNCNVMCCRGSEEDVLERYYEAAKIYNVQNIVRITSDCPLVDAGIIDEVLQFYFDGDYDIATNVPNEWEEMTYPRGLDLEIFSFEWLERAYKEAVSDYDHEHVSTYIYDKAEKKGYYRYQKDYSKYRWTLDTEEDWELIQKIYGALYRGTHDFGFLDIIRVMEEHPEWEKINAGVCQKHK